MNLDVNFIANLNERIDHFSCSPSLIADRQQLWKWKKKDGSICRVGSSLAVVFNVSDHENTSIVESFNGSQLLALFIKVFTSKVCRMRQQEEGAELSWVRLITPF